MSRDHLKHDIIVSYTLYIRSIIEVEKVYNYSFDIHLYVIHLHIHNIMLYIHIHGSSKVKLQDTLVWKLLVVGGIPVLSYSTVL